MGWKEIPYKKLNGRQKENYNFAKLSAILADFGFATIRLSDDWNGADVIAVHIDGPSLQVQLKGRLHFKKKYMGRSLFLAFPDSDHHHWYLCPHDELLEKVIESKPKFAATWSKFRDGYSFPRLDLELKELLEEYKIEERRKAPLLTEDDGGDDLD